MSDIDPFPLAPLDLAIGSPLGHVRPPPRVRELRPNDPRRALEEVVLGGLRRPPCVVAFSGGRDSSLILTVATDLAREHGLSLPIPVTRRFSDAPKTEEASWQEEVIRHLRLADWIRVELGDEMDLLGERTRRRLVRYGVTFSPVLVGDEWLFEVGAGGTVLDGEGGDETLDPLGHRGAAAAELLRQLRHRHRPSSSLARDALGSVTPGGARARLGISRRLVREVLPWLQPAALDEAVRRLRADARLAPIDLRRSIAWTQLTRAWAHVSHNRRAFAAHHDVVLASPLFDSTVVDAIALAAGPAGFRTRAHGLRLLGGARLPHSVLHRRTAASFNEAIFREPTRAFVRRWNGDGLDPDLVDAEILRDHWNSPNPSAPSAALVQAAWLATEGRPHTTPDVGAEEVPPWHP